MSEFLLLAISAKWQSITISNSQYLCLFLLGKNIQSNSGIHSINQCFPMKNTAHSRSVEMTNIVSCQHNSAAYTLGS